MADAFGDDLFNVFDEQASKPNTSKSKSTTEKSQEPDKSDIQR